VEIPPAPLPQSPVAQLVQRQAHSAPISYCEAPRDLAGCTEMARLRVGRVELSSPTCWVDAKVRAGDEGRLMKCASGAVAVFSRFSFAGTWGEGGIDTCLRTEFPYEDGCRWETMQRMRGGPSSIEYTYAEKPIAGERCAPSWCRARADVEVLPP
jgi:hypothetical protein